VLGISDAEHEESAPEAPTLVISKLLCSLVAQAQPVFISPGSCAYHAYRQAEVTEQFNCNYGLNPAFRDRISAGPLHITGVDQEGEVRIVELTDHPFFVATLFQPQLSSQEGQPHPLITAYLSAALAHRTDHRQAR
jgi:CTP synthase (UTP-ammonia lyase)